MTQLSRAGRKRIGGLLSLMMFVVLVQGLRAQDQVFLIENRLAREELQLARTPSLYFIVNLKTGTISLKSRGMILQEWKIESWHSWGGALSPDALTLQKKSTLFPPKRTRIKPAAGEEDAVFEPDALELKDMPSRFSLFMTGGLRIYVRPKADGFLPRLGNFGPFLAWYVGAPLLNLSSELRKKPFAALEIVLFKKEDCRALYWAFPDGVKGLVYPL